MTPAGRLRLARALVTFPAAILAVVPALADLNATHAAHPQWPAHARLHAVWLVATTTLVCVVALGMLWGRGRAPTRGRVLLASALPGAVLAGFFLAAATQALYGGAFTDPGGVAITVGTFDANLAGFSMMALVLAAGVGLAATADRDTGA